MLVLLLLDETLVVLNTLLVLSIFDLVVCNFKLELVAIGSMLFFEIADICS